MVYTRISYSLCMIWIMDGSHMTFIQFVYDMDYGW